MKTIHKYSLLYGVPTYVEMPIGSKVLTALMQRDQDGEKIRLWAQIDTDHKNETRSFVALPTGQEIAPAIVDKLVYINTIIDGMFVWHVFEINESPID